MSVVNPENIKENHTQPFTLRLVIVFAGVLIALPLLPAVITNLAYSFSGQAPKIYWYLSRASGFIALTILWVSMAMGLGLTNKLARRWPGAPAAFAIHEYVSLLGLLFAAYHGLVLMGDHYVDFSLPRLLVPFSIKYEPFWVGLGQVAFYTWAIVLLSFYVRQYIGQKTWRMIHYANFVVYMMGLFHGLFSGTDGTAAWAHWYYGLSAATLIALAGYRIYITVNKQSVSRPKPAVQPGHASPTPAITDAPSPAILTAPEKGTPQQEPSMMEQTSPQMEFPIPVVEEHQQPVPAPETVTMLAEPENIPQFLSIEEEQVPASGYVIAETQLQIEEQTPVTLKIFAEVPIPPADPLVHLKVDPCVNQKQISAYLEPATAPSRRVSKPNQASELDKIVIPNIRIHADAEPGQAHVSPLILRIKENLPSKPTQPVLVIRSRKRDEIAES